MFRNSRFFAKKQDFIRVYNPKAPMSKESGSVIIWIFAMIAIFAALNYTISKGTRTGESNISKQQADLAATEILDYTSAIKRAVQELMINGCSDTEINFVNPRTTLDYTNPNAPSDGSCDIFNINGGGLTYLKPEENWLDSSFEATYPNNYGEWRFNGSWNYKDVGSSEAELAINLNFLKPEICLALNNSLGIANPSNLPPQETFDAGNGIFTGNFGTPPPVNGLGDDGGHDLAGKTSYCYEATASNVLQITQVLIAR